MRPAGFWRRAAAWSLDALPAGVLALVICLPRLRAAGAAFADAWQPLVDALAQRMVDVAMAGDAAPGGAALLALVRGALQDPAVLASAAALQAALPGLLLPPLVAFVALFAAWSLAFERSPLRATPGKRVLGMHVATVDGGAPGMARLLLRFLAGGLSWLSLNIGHVLAAVAPAHATLHDRASGTRVLLDASAPARMPRWALAWLWLQAAGLLVASAWAGARLAAAMQLALERAFY